MATPIRNVICTMAAGMLAVSFLVAGQKSQQSSKGQAAGSFETPIKKVTIDLGPSPGYPFIPKVRDSLSCFYFPHLLIKQYDEEGNLGAVWLSILRTRRKLPLCKPSHEPGERVIKTKEWEGDFKGVKGNFVFFDWCESQFSKLSFAVFDSTTGKMLFEDDAYVSQKAGPPNVRAFSTKTGVTIKYLRAYLTDCNLHAKGRECWEKVKAKLALKSDRIPVCTGYDFIAELAGTDDVESWIAYPVEVTLSPHPVIKPVAGPVKCWPTN